MLRVILLVFVAACSNGSDTVEQEVPPPVAGVASVALMLDVEAIDPASDLGDPLVTAAQITLSTVELVYDDGSRHLIADSSRTLDLLTPTNTITLGVADVPAGTITAVDVLVDGASVTRDGEVLSVSGVGPTSIAVPWVTVEVDCTRVVTASFDPNTSFDFVPPDDPDLVPGRCDRVFDFEGLPSGAKLRDQLAPAVTVSCDNARNGGPDECIVFDTDNITGGDDDLTAGNGNVVIIAENVTDSDGDGLVDDPDDDAAGGVQTYTFDPAIDVDSVFIVDIDLNEDNGKLVVTGEDGTTTERELPPIGNASIQTIDVREENVAKLEVHLPASGGIDDIAYHVECDEPGEPGPGSFAFDPMFEFSESELICDELPPDPALIAPPMDETGFPLFYDQISFLFDGSDSIQTGVDNGAIAPSRASVLHGFVSDHTGAPAPGVEITVLGRPEFGGTFSRVDGRFDLAVNGGATLTLVYKKEEFLTAHRKVRVGWNEHAHAHDVVLLRRDSTATTIDFSEPIEVARGSVQTDADGTRQATLFFRQGTSVSLVLGDGSTVPAPEITVRATEYTVGDVGPTAMPVGLPTFSAYTYAVELSVDEAVVLGSDEVRFDQPVSVFVENFVGFPVGEEVPAGYYDRVQAAWVPIESGRTIELLGVTGGLAELDVDGSGTPADAGALAALGIDDDERRQLAAEFGIGAELWRVEVHRFSPYDFNWGVGCLATVQCAPPEAGEMRFAAAFGDDCPIRGSVLETQRQSAGEMIPLAGVPFDLHYRSGRQLGYQHARTLSIPLRGPGSQLPEGVEQTVLAISNSGPQDGETTFGDTPPDVFNFVWSGLDEYGRPLRGTRRIGVRLDYGYPLTYARADFAALPRTVSPIVGRGSFFLSQQRSAVVSNVDDRSRALGGWSLGVHHRYDAATGDVLLGDGELIAGDSVVPTIETALGGGLTRPDTSWMPATEARLVQPVDLTASPTGSLYIVDSGHNCVLELRDEEVRTVFGECGRARQNEPLVYDIPATEFLFRNPVAVALGPNDDLYVADDGLDMVFAASARTGLVRHVAGSGVTSPGPLTTPAPADQAEFDPRDIAVDDNGTVYISNTTFDCVLAATPDRVVRPAVGTCRRISGWGSVDLEGALATSLPQLGEPTDLAIKDDGTLLIALMDTNTANRVIEVRRDGTVRTVAGGNGQVDNGLDGVDGRDIVFADPVGLGLDRQGGFYVTDTRFQQRIWHIDSAGIGTVLGGSSRGFEGDGGELFTARFDEPGDVERGFDGVIYIADTGNRVVRKSSRIPDTTTIPSEDGEEIYLFDPYGRHLRTVDAETMVDLWSFGYDAEQRLESVTDVHGNTTTIERNAAGTPTAIVGPYGHRTTLLLNGDGYLVEVEDPVGQATSMAYGPQGLLETFTNRRGHTTTFTYDAAGFLVGHEDAVSADSAFDRVETDGNEWAVAVTTPEGRATSYRSAFDSLGYSRENTFPSGQTASVSVDRAGTRVVELPDGRVVTSDIDTDPRFGARTKNQGTFTTHMPSGLQNQTTITEFSTLADPDDPLTLTELTTVTDVNGRVFTESYDVATRIREEVTPEGRVTTTELDASGREVRTELPGRLPTTTTYDTRGNVIATTQGTRTWTYTYDPGTNDLRTVTNPLGETTTFTYDLLGRLQQEDTPLGNVTSFGYDPEGNMTSLTPPGQPAHTFSYTPVDLESHYTPPVLPDVSMPQTAYDYSLDRELELETRPDGRVIDWQYDSAGRLSKLAFAAETRDYSYDATTGQLTSITSTSGEGLAFEYDGDLVTKTTWSGTVNASVEKQYDENFWVVRETVNGAWPVDYVYDDDGLLVQAGDMTITRDPVTGFVVATELDNITTQTTYNAYGERETYTAWFQSTMLYWEEHERDDLGRITKTTEIVEGVQKVWEYAYDLDGRLAEAYVDGDLRYSYTYDANGNRTQFEDSVAGVLITADYDDQDRLLRYGDTTYTYTENGERLSATSPSGVTTYDYDVFSNLRSLMLHDGTVVDYSVDASNRRVATFENGSFNDGFVYRDQLKPIARISSGGTVDQRFVYGTVGQVPSYHDDGSTVSFYVTDLRGSVRLVIEAETGVSLESIDYSPFGIPTAIPTAQPFGFDGGLADVTGLVRLGERDYDPTSARWTSKDPAGLSPNPDLYQFADNDPVNLVDRTGRGASPPGDRSKPRRGRETGDGPICPLKDKKLKYPGDCNSKKLKKACNKNGCYTEEGSKHTLCYNGDDEHITTIPHTSKEGGTCRSNIKAINKNCLGD